MRKASLDPIKRARMRVIYLPLVIGVGYLFASIVLFLISPMFAVSRHGMLAVLYGILALVLFSGGYHIGVGMVGPRTQRLKISKASLNAIILVMCLINLVVFLPQLRLSLSYFHFNGFSDIFRSVGQNYFQKDLLIAKIGENSLGTAYTVLNLMSFTQCAAYVVGFFKWKMLIIPLRVLLLITAGVTGLFYMSIGTMSGVFFLTTFSVMGWLAGKNFEAFGNARSIIKINKQMNVILVRIFLVGLAFFVFMVFTLTSRMETAVVDQPFLYPSDSFLYQLLGKRLADGVGIALSYISQGWYGLSNCFEVDFRWTEGMSFSRVFADYYHRFAGIDLAQRPASYPLRQQWLTGYPAYVNWFTIFPWLASDFTFPGALLISAVFGVAYGRSWSGTVREGCLVSASIFGLLSLGVLFMNANSLILDSKTLSLALLGLCAFLPFRKLIELLP